MQYEKARRFVKETARPLDLALYRHFYEGGSRQDVINELAAYQNKDGGFGHGLEPDNWNANSNPIATNDAMILLYRIGALTLESDMVKAIVHYLKSHDSFNVQKGRWLFAIESNKDYPHASWWEKGDADDGIHKYNPTVSLATLMVCAGENVPYYSSILNEAFDSLPGCKNADELKCFLLSYTLLRHYDINHIVDLNDTQNVLSYRLEAAICKDASKYGIEYATAPSDFFPGIYEELITPSIRDLITAECNAMGSCQKNDGGFDITWTWGTSYTEFEQARNWWRARITLDKLLFWDLVNKDSH